MCIKITIACNLGKLKNNNMLYFQPILLLNVIYYSIRRVFERSANHTNSVIVNFYIMKVICFWQVSREWKKPSLNTIIVYYYTEKNQNMLEVHLLEYVTWFVGAP